MGSAPRKVSEKTIMVIGNFQKRKKLVHVRGYKREINDIIGHRKNRKYCCFLGVDKYMWESCLIVDDIFSIVGKFFLW